MQFYREAEPSSAKNINYPERLIAGHSVLVLANRRPETRVGKSKSRGARREFSRPSPASSPPVRQDEKFFFSPEAAGGRDRDRDRDQLRGKVEEGLILYLNTGLSEDYMHFNYRPDAAALTLSRRPGIVKFLNYRYSGQGCGALNPKDSLHFELLTTLDTKVIPVASSSNDKKASLLGILLANLNR